jgi:hypothetical protein
LSILVTPTDPTDAELQAVHISQVPAGATLSKGVNLGGGLWWISIPDLTGLSITFPDDGAYTLKVEAISAHTVSHLNAVTATLLPIAVSNLAPVLTVSAIQTVRPGHPGAIDLGTFVDTAVDGLWQVEVNYGDGSAPISWMTSTPGALGAPAHVYQTHGRYDATVIVRDKDGAAAVQTFAVNVAPAEVEVVILGDGTIQRSRVGSMTVVFTGPVEILPGAFSLQDAQGRAVPFNITTQAIGAKTIANLTFAGRTVVGGSLADGRYVFLIDGSRILDRTRINATVDPDGDGQTGDSQVYPFVRRFGDLNGDGRVDRAEANLFRSSYNRRVGDPAYIAAFDYNGNGRIDSLDRVQFNRRLSGR